MIRNRILIMMVVGLAMMGAYQVYGLKSAQALDKDLMFYSTVAAKFSPVQNAASVSVAQDVITSFGPCCNCTCAGDSSCSVAMTGRDCSVQGGVCKADGCDVEIELAE